MKKDTSYDFILKSNNTHNNKYNYSLVEYKNSKIKVKIICPIHGEFDQLPYSHIQGKGCPHCSRKKPYTTQSFIDKAITIHGDRYDYSLVEYINNKIKVKIICPIHGIFEQKPSNHLIQKQGCSKCYGNHRYSTEEFITKAKQVHGDRYDYSLVEYKNGYTYIDIVCKKHGIFRQRSQDHLRCHGCPFCISIISKQEIEMVNYIKSIYDDKVITNTRKIITPYELDVYLPDINLAFEYNGIYWHNEGITKPIGYHQMKTDMCDDKGVVLYHIWENEWMGNIQNTKEKIKRRINNQKQL